jgi:ATP-dependent DNA ligase
MPCVLGPLSSDVPALPAGAVAEPKWDGIRGWVARFADGRVLIRSRNGTVAFPEFEAAAAGLPGVPEPG